MSDIRYCIHVNERSPGGVTSRAPFHAFDAVVDSQPLPKRAYGWGGFLASGALAKAHPTIEPCPRGVGIECALGGWTFCCTGAS